MGASFSKLKSKFFPTKITKKNLVLQTENDNLLNEQSNENETFVANDKPDVSDGVEDVHQIESNQSNVKIEHFSNASEDYSDYEESNMDFFCSVENRLTHMFDSSNMQIEIDEDHRSDVMVYVDGQVLHDEKLEIKEECCDDEITVKQEVFAENEQNEQNVIFQKYLASRANIEHFVSENADSKISEIHDFQQNQYSVTELKLDFDIGLKAVEVQQMEINQCFDAYMNVKQEVSEENDDFQHQVVNQNYLYPEVSMEQFDTEILDLQNPNKFDSLQHQSVVFESDEVKSNDNTLTQEVDVQNPETFPYVLHLKEQFLHQNVIDPNHLYPTSPKVNNRIATKIADVQDIENYEQNQCLVRNEPSNIVQHYDNQRETIKRRASTVKNVEKINRAKSFKPPKDVVLANSRTSHKIVVDPDVAVHLKEHQIDGIKFMYNCCFRDKSGCILAHCMGLGKTFQTIALLHTAINEAQLETNQILVICPKSTIMNWKHEFEMWLKPVKGKRRIKTFILPETSNLNTKLSILKNWSAHGKGNKDEASCFLINYEAFRILIDYPNLKKSIEKHSVIELNEIQNKIQKYLLDPADVVICDEGHTIKNDKTATCRAVSQIRTKRRIILTGTPMQNHLMEYYTMVNFVKPTFVSSKDKFEQRYAKPIKAGQHSDSSPEEVAEMKKCSYALHEKLKVCVQRKEVSILKDFLPEKFEYVLFVPLTEQQITLYKHFLENTIVVDGKNLFTDYHLLRKIWTHPKVLDMAFHEAVAAKKKKTKRSTVKDEDDSEDEELYDVGSNLSMKLQQDWWRNLLTVTEFESILPSYKLILLFEILKECKKANDKCLIFSSFVQVLNVVEFFLKQINEQTKSGKAKRGLENFNGTWELGWDYFRLDGSITKSARQDMIDSFNDQVNQRVRLFLISAKAGGQGINLVGANRVILLDSSWNPSNDQQNFFRVFRLGQTKSCYIYRLLSMGTMEEKIYSRSVTKQAMSYRVVDKQQVDRHYSMADLMELYSLNIPKMDERLIPNFPKDDVLAHLLNNFPKMIYKYHIHDSLLESNEEIDLNEDEKAEAWRKFEDEDTFDRSVTALEVVSTDPQVPALYMPSFSSVMVTLKFESPEIKKENNKEDSTLLSSENQPTKFPQSPGQIEGKNIKNSFQSDSKRIPLEKGDLKTKDESEIDFITSQMSVEDYVNSTTTIESRDMNASQQASQAGTKASEVLKLSPKLKRRSSIPIIQPVLKKIRFDDDVVRQTKPSTLNALSPVQTSPQRRDNQSHELDNCYQFHTYWKNVPKPEDYTKDKENHNYFHH